MTSVLKNFFKPEAEQELSFSCVVFLLSVDDGNCSNDINIPTTGSPDACGSFDREPQLQISGDSTTWEINTEQATLGTPDYEWIQYEKQDIKEDGALGTNAGSVDVSLLFLLDEGTIQLTNDNLPEGREDAAVLLG